MKITSNKHGFTLLSVPRGLKIISSPNGFTIVELLVVIVVIGILAAITIVSYSGISQRATMASLQSDLDNSSRLLKMYQVEHNSYPTSFDANNCPLGATAPSPDTKYCIKPSSNTYTYHVNNTFNPQTFYLENINGSNVAVIEDGTTNNLLNSDFEVDSNNDSVPDSWSSATVYAGGTGSVYLDGTVAVHGSKSYYLNKTNSVGQLFVSQLINTNPVNTYTYSCWVKSNTTSALIDIGHDSTWSALNVPSNKLNQWTRLSVTFTNTTTTSSTVRLGIYGNSGIANFDYCQLINSPDPFS